MRVQRKPRPKVYSQAEAAARWRARHPERDKATRDRQRLDRRARIAEIKAQAGCARCGFDDPRALDFHHLDPASKTLAVSQLIARASWQAVLDEIDRCEVVCANCHRILHHEEDAVREDSDITAQIAAAGLLRAA